MRVGVEKAVAQNHVAEAIDEFLRHDLGLSRVWGVDAKGGTTSRVNVRLRECA
jgi:hypothetical protein